MFGSQYSRHPEMLVQSLREMNDRYAHGFSGMIGWSAWLAGIYIRIFGIPEIGFQVRGMYFRQALRSFMTFSPKTILDVGSGIGCYSFHMAKRFPRARVTGWEIDRSKLAYSQQLSKEFQAENTAFVFGDIVNPPKKKNSFDLITIIDVMEHIPDYKKALNNMYTLLNPSGYVYIHVPQIKQVRFFREFRSWEHADHVREGFAPASLVQDLQHAGFVIVSVRNSFGYFGSFAWELNHMLLAKSKALAAVCYPFLYVVSLVDGMIRNQRGLCVAIIAQKHA